MGEVLDFIRASVPWLAVGLLLSVLFAIGARKKSKKEQTDNYGTEGMCIGTAIGTAVGNNTGIGISLGMLIGLAVGTFIKKGNSGEDNHEKE